MEIEYRDWDWNPLGKVEVSENVFAAPLRKDIIARVINWQRAKSRQGTASTKTLSTVSGTTRKPWAQKETGKSRQGSLRAPHFRGGGVVFGPHPRDYEHKLNKQVRRLGSIASLSFKLKEGLFSVLETLDAPFEKTSGFDAWLKARDFKSTLFVLSDNVSDEGLFKCIRNVPYCDVIPVRGLNVLDIVKHKNIICDLIALKEIEARYDKSLVEITFAESALASVSEKEVDKKKVKIVKDVTSKSGSVRSAGKSDKKEIA